MSSAQRSAKSHVEPVQNLQMSSLGKVSVRYKTEQSTSSAYGILTSRNPSSTPLQFPTNKGSESVQQPVKRMDLLPNPSQRNSGRNNVQQPRNAGKSESTHNSGDMRMILEGQDDGASDDSSSINLNHSRNTGPLELESIPATSWLPSSFDEVRKLIRTHEANIMSHREYIVEAEIANAKVTSTRNLHVNTERRASNPFKRMIASEQRAEAFEPSSTTLSLRIKARRNDYTNLKIKVNELDEDKAAHIPEYKSIGRLRSTFLARNVHGLKFVPYNSGIEEKDLDQRRKDLETSFKDHSSEEFRRQRECLESVYQWSIDFDEILQELRITPTQLWVWLISNGLKECQKCEISCGSPPVSLDAAELTKAERQRCQWLYEALIKITHIELWHFLISKPGHIEKHPPAKGDQDGVVQKKEQLLCSLCFTHNCLVHGSFIDEEVVVGEAVINDAEQQNNERQKPVLRMADQYATLHACGLFCIPEWHNGNRSDVRDIIGLGNDGQLTGVRNRGLTMLVELGPFRENEPCTHVCFLRKANRKVTSRRGLLISIEGVDRVKKSLVVSMSRLYPSHLRLPCMIAKVTGVKCTLAFYTLLATVNDSHSQGKEDLNPSTTENAEARKVAAKTAGYNTARSSLLDDRKTWVPCSHKGPCLSTHSDCACARDQVHCERACGCSDNCRRRFRGCRCKKTCFLDDRCDCFAANRECDPMLCHDCGVEEVLDPSNKYRDDIRNGRCQNNRLQLDLPPRTVKGISEVQGWGLFLGEDLPANSFVGEYKGENVSASESDRRGAIYAYVSQEYLFNLNQDNQLDGSRFGNKTRFINNSKAKEFINMFPKVMFVNGVTRIGLFTNRAIRAGEELLYDYGYPSDLVEGEFWEKYQRANEHNGVITPIAKPKFRPRMAKNAVDTPGQDDEDDDNHTLSSRKNNRFPPKGKRKRRMEEIFADSDEEEETQVMSGRYASVRSDTNSSDFEADERGGEPSSEDGMTSHDSGVEEVDESEDELSVPMRRVVPARLDRRRGGEAQRRAARTRKLNKLRGKS